MKKLDPRLRHLLRQRNAPSPEFAERLGVRSSPQSPQLPNTVGVLVRCVGDSALDELRRAGMNINFTIPGAYTVASGEVSLDNLERLGELSFVERVEVTRPMVEELNLSRSETCTHSLHLNSPRVKGAGVIIGIVDGGIDYTHPSFRHEDDSSRILFLWDQGGQFDPNGNVRYGREYTQQELDEALRCSAPFTVVPHLDRSGHGTHVAGIAAGNGRVSDGEFTGIAPDADLIVVAGSSREYLGNPIVWTRGLFDAFVYIVQRAKGHPVVINLSQGINGGGHSGETVLETGLDNLIRQPNVIAVKSAGNEQQRLIHAGGQIRQGQTVALEFEVQNNNPQEILEVWYEGADQISVALQPPGSSPLSFVTLGDDGQEFFRTWTGNEIRVDFDLDAEDTGDTRATIILLEGNAEFIQQGIWKLLLRGDSVQVGRYDIWIDRVVGGTQFLPGCADNSRMITIPGNAKRIITVGSYITRPPADSNLPYGQISSFSSRGPTRYGLQKPEIAAPGEMIISARSGQSRQQVPANPDRWHTDMRGTSMAAPHVTGAAALILSVRQDLTCEQVKQILIQTAQCDEFTSSGSDITWGSGKLNVEAAIERVYEAQFPQISNVQVNGTTLSWHTDIPTTSTVRFHTHQLRLQLGKHLDSQEDSMLHTDHTMTLNGLSPGINYCEILAFSADNWWTADDNGGEFYAVII